MANILVIDDDKDILELFKAVLKTNDHQVTLVDNAQAGIKLLNNQTFDLIITDILMPNIDGIELIRILKTNYPKIKVMAMSGGGSNRKKFLEYLSVARRLGADHVLPKPFDVNDILAIVDKLLYETH